MGLPIPGQRGGSMRLQYYPGISLDISQGPHPSGEPCVEWEGLENLQQYGNYYPDNGAIARCLRLGEPGFPLRANRITYKFTAENVQSMWWASIGPYWPNDLKVKTSNSGLKCMSQPLDLVIKVSATANKTLTVWNLLHTDRYFSYTDPPFDPYNVISIGNYTNWVTPSVTGTAAIDQLDGLELYIDFLAYPDPGYNPRHSTELWFRGIASLMTFSSPLNPTEDMSDGADASLSIQSTTSNVYGDWSMFSAATNTDLELGSNSNVILNAVLAGDGDLLMTGLGDASANLTYTDSTAWGTFGLGTSGDLRYTGALSGGADLTLINEDVDMTYIAGLKSAAAPFVNLFDGTESYVWGDVSLYSFNAPFTMGFDGSLAQELVMSAATASFSLSGAGNMVMQKPLACNQPITLSAISQIFHIKNMTAGTDLTLDSAADGIDRLVDLDGDGDLLLTSWAAVTYFRPQPALPENTFSYGRTQQEIEWSRRGSDLVVEARPRTVSARAKERTIIVRQQQGT